MNLRFIYVLVSKIFKIILNQMLYTGEGLGMKTNLVRRFLFQLVPYFKSVLLVMYFFWFVLVSLFQILFHYIPFPMKSMNIIIIIYFIFSCLIMMNYGVSADIRNYALNTSFPYKQKIKLILMNEYLGSVLTWGFIFIFSLPLFVLQVVLNGVTGLTFMSQALILLLIAGFIIGFLKFAAFVITDRYTIGVSKILLPILYLGICIILSLNQSHFGSFLHSFINKVMNGSLVQWIMELEVLSKVNLYEYKISLVGYISLLSIVLICLILLYLFSKKLIVEKENSQNVVNVNLLKRKFLYIFLNILREKGIINVEFFLTYIGSLIVLIFSIPIGLQTANLALFSTYLLVSLFLNHDSVQTVLFCKRHKTPLLHSAFMLSIPMLIQFTLMICILCLTKSVEVDGSVLDLFFSGILLIIVSMSLYCNCIYKLETIFDEKIFKKLGKAYIVVFFLVVVGFQLLMHSIGINNKAISIIISVLFVYYLTSWMLHRITRVRGLKYD